MHSPSKVVAQFVCALSSILLVLTGLLICYNPRDEIEVELLKSGVMTTDDVEAIRRLKEETLVNTRRGTISLDRLDALHAEQKKSRDKSGFGIASRKRMTRVSPTSGG